MEKTKMMKLIKYLRPYLKILVLPYEKKIRIFSKKNNCPIVTTIVCKNSKFEKMFTLQDKQRKNLL
jgi:hypothetical protein